MSRTKKVQAIQLSYIEETEFGVKKTGSDLKVLRITGESLKQESSIKNSSEISSDRQVSASKRTSVMVSGGIDAEMSFESHDDLIKAAMFSAGWSSPVTVSASTISAAASDNSFSDSGNGFGSLAAGQWVKVSGFTTSGNNGYFKIVTAAAGKITVSGGTLTDESAGNSVSIVAGAQVVNGTTKTSFNIERKLTDFDDELSLFLGCMIDTFGITVGLDDMITSSFSIVGKNEELLTASAGTGYTDANSNEIFDSADNILAIFDNQQAIDTAGFTFQVSNNARKRNKAGLSSPTEINMGTADFSGTIQPYFENSTLYKKYIDFASTSIAAIFADAAGNAYVFDLPCVKFEDHDPVTGDGESDIVPTISWKAYKDATEGITARIVKFPA